MHSPAVPRLLILLAALPILAAFVGRWWFGLKILAQYGRHQCKCDIERWNHTFGADNLPISATGDARIYADFLRKAALLDWKTREPKAAGSREGTRRFCTAVPPLSLMIAILALFVAKIGVSMAIAIFLSAIAACAITSYLSIAPELKAVLTATRRMKDAGIFQRSDDTEAIGHAAIALVWRESAPPIFNLIQR